MGPRFPTPRSPAAKVRDRRTRRGVPYLCLTKARGSPTPIASTRRLAAILTADVAGYSRLMGR